MRIRRATLEPANRWGRYATAVVAVVVALVVLLVIGQSTSHKTLSGAQLRQFGPTCASSGHLVSVAAVHRVAGAERVAGPRGKTVYRVHCSGGLTTDVAR